MLRLGNFVDWHLFDLVISLWSAYEREGAEKFSAPHAHTRTHTPPDNVYNARVH